jgi:hypothetical protein
MDILGFTDAVNLSVKTCAEQGHSGPFIVVISIRHLHSLGEIVSVDVPNYGQVDIVFKQSLAPDRLMVMAWDVYLKSHLKDME